MNQNSKDEIKREDRHSLQPEVMFRAWHINKQIMITPAVIDQHGHAYESEYDFGERNYMSCHLMQYTGLKDKHGEKIYSGDVVKTYRSTYEVKWVDAGFNISTTYIDDGGGDCAPITITNTYEVIGNIFEGVKSGT